MLFKNYAGGIDVYMRVSSWEQDLWSHYQIEDQAMPEDWHNTKAMRWISNDIWPMDELPDKKRKRNAMNEENEEDNMCLYMTPRSYERFRVSGMCPWKNNSL